ncbi:MAG: Hsp20/alpha crystallin family protein [Syntrophales bacterium]|jgi:HSP20 family protein|nr:Hsp20/alpha crystallin family protein [Syntrophales bacterium]MCK9527379.1 Hsp20/alpha crystallin family protein [Syntrophales bacterium]MDX9921481.1 Hsp20/alpha crystallin family protein [Syntrophales bacterium]
MWLTGLRGFDWMPDLWSELDRRQRESGRLFSRSGTSRYQNYPAVNLWMNENDVILSAEIPGIDLEKMDISVEGDVLDLSGSRSLEAVGEEAKYHRQERPYGSFRRKIRLPFSINSEKVDARYEKGVLTVRLPRIEEEKPRKISIKSE